MEIQARLSGKGVVGGKPPSCSRAPFGYSGPGKRRLPRCGCGGWAGIGRGKIRRTECYRPLDAWTSPLLRTTDDLAKRQVNGLVISREFRAIQTNFQGRWKDRMSWYDAIVGTSTLSVGNHLFPDRQKLATRPDPGVREKKILRSGDIGRAPSQYGRIPGDTA
jgi:hypothetical protein